MGTPPPPPSIVRPDKPFFPFSSFAEFKLTEWAIRFARLSGANVKQLSSIWSELHPKSPLPFNNLRELRAKIDSIEQGDIGWSSFKIQYKGHIDASSAAWKKKEYEVWFRDPLMVAEQQISNKDFANEIDWAPKRIFDANGNRVYTDLASGDWMWNQAVFAVIKLCRHVY